jgi:lipoprotein-releasing system permease protein
MVMGVTGSVIGIVAAVFTLNNLDAIVHFMSVVQGHQAFNPLFYGDSLPNEISGEVMLYVISATAIISLLSGLVPALKASLLRPSTILRAE